MVLARQTGWDAPPRIKDAPGGLQSWAKGVGMIRVLAQLSQSQFYPEANYPALLAFWENFNPSTRVLSQLSSCTLEPSAGNARLFMLVSWQVCQIGHTQCETTKYGHISPIFLQILASLAERSPIL
jgi:hypothetical protein